MAATESTIRFSGHTLDKATKAKVSRAFSAASVSSSLSFSFSSPSSVPSFTLPVFAPSYLPRVPSPANGSSQREAEAKKKYPPCGSDRLCLSYLRDDFQLVLSHPPVNEDGVPFPDLSILLRVGDVGELLQ